MTGLEERLETSGIYAEGLDMSPSHVAEESEDLLALSPTRDME